jgi:hypothetical protein
MTDTTLPLVAERDNEVRDYLDRSAAGRRLRIFCRGAVW